jgi:carbon-monoxide dehydrogenase medium subunit
VSALQAASPRHRSALLTLLSQTDGPTVFVSGGTDLLVAPRRLPDEGMLVDLSGVEDLAYVESSEHCLRIGAATTIDTLSRNPLISLRLPALAQAAALCGSAQIRNRATIGGNVATASPASDLTPVLKCFGASFGLLSRNGDRRVDFEALLPAEGGNRLRHGELIAEIDFPLQDRSVRSAFVKLGTRDDVTIARLNLAIVTEFDSGDLRFGNTRVVAGALAPSPLRLSAVEQVLDGRPWNRATARSFAEALVSSVDAAIPGRASQRYKRRALMGLGFDLLQTLTGEDFSDEVWL